MSAKDAASGTYGNFGALGIFDAKKVTRDCMVAELVEPAPVEEGERH